MKHCPFCSGEVQDSAQKCKYCGEWLEKAGNPPERADENPADDVTKQNALDENNTQKGSDVSGIGGWLILPLLGLLYVIFSTLSGLGDVVFMRGDILEESLCYGYIDSFGCDYVSAGSILTHSLFHKKQKIPECIHSFSGE